MNTYDPNSFQQYNDSNTEETNNNFHAQSMSPQNETEGQRNRADTDWSRTYYSQGQRNGQMSMNSRYSTPGGRKPKKKNSIRKKIAAFAALTVLFGATAGGTFYGAKTIAGKVAGAVESAEEQQEQQEAKEKGTQTNESAAANSGKIGSTADANKQSSLTKAVSDTDYDLDVADIAENTMPAMVAITNTSVEKVRNFFYGGMQDYESVSKGTGVIVGQNDSEILIATNAHVINNADTISVTFVDETTVEGAVKGSDTKNDLAVVAVPIADISEDTFSQIKFVEIGDSDEVRVGEQVVAIGNALGYGQSVSSGYLSAKDRGVETVETQNAQQDEEQGETAGLLQTDAAINPGNSGGALLNMQGQLIGINSAKYADTSVEGMGFAIPINSAAPILEDMMNRETRTKVSKEDMAYFGITCYSVSEEAAQYYHIPEGVYVQDVSQGGAAEKAGIKQGDIITAIDDQEITSDEELTNTLSYYASGDKATVTIARAGAGGQYEDVTVEITFGKRPQQ